jgi:hypothetical protein
MIDITPVCRDNERGEIEYETARSRRYVHPELTARSPRARARPASRPTTSTAGTASPSRSATDFFCDVDAIEGKAAAREHFGKRTRLPKPLRRTILSSQRGIVDVSSESTLASSAHHSRSAVRICWDGYHVERGHGKANTVLFL